MTSRDKLGKKIVGKDTKLKLGSSGSSHSSKGPLFNSKPKSSSSHKRIGIIWIPGKRHHKKEYTYQPHKEGEHREKSTFGSMSGDSSEKGIQLKEMEKSPERALAATDAVRTAGALEPLIIKKEEVPTVKLPPSESSQGVPKESSGDSAVTEESKEKSASTPKRDDSIYVANTDDNIDGPVLTNDVHSTEKDAFTDDEEENEKEECIVTCLYYTSQCCDCSIM